MEDATIQSQSSEQGMYQGSQFPSVVTTDDLVFEMGKNVVDRLNKEKLLNSLLSKSKIAEKTATQFMEDNKTVLKKFEELSSSNKLYEENNRVLGDELVRIRQELMSKNETILMFENELEKIRQELKVALKQFDNLTEKYSTAVDQKSISDLKCIELENTIKELKSNSKKSSKKKSTLESK